jgi:hypothetical protein
MWQVTGLEQDLVIPVFSSPKSSQLGGITSAGHWSLTPIILVTQEAEIKRIEV